MNYEIHFYSLKLLLRKKTDVLTIKMKLMVKLVKSNFKEIVYLWKFNRN